jgi:hypothetical protein
MISVYQAFKIVMGLTISGFILYFLVFYAGTYAGFQEETNQAKVFSNFRTLTKDIYYSGITFTFDFSAAPLELTFDETRPAGLFSELGKSSMPVPTLFKPGDNYVLDRKDLNMGWWDFRMVEATPDMRIVFNPLDERSPGVMVKIAEMMPDTFGLDPHVYFGLCDGGVIADTCIGNQPCDASMFVLENLAGDFSECTADLGPNDVLVTIDLSCDVPSKGVCIEPSDGEIGMALLAGQQKVYYWKDYLDLAALIIGGSEIDIFGVGGDKLFTYKNRVFADEISLAADIMATRANLIVQVIETNAVSGNLTSESGTYSCAQDNLFADLAASLRKISNQLENPDYYTNEDDARALVKELETASGIYQNLVNRGCDYIVI